MVIKSSVLQFAANLLRERVKFGTAHGVPDLLGPFHKSKEDLLKQIREISDNISKSELARKLRVAKGFYSLEMAPPTNNEIKMEELTSRLRQALAFLEYVMLRTVPHLLGPASRGSAMGSCVFHGTGHHKLLASYPDLCVLYVRRNSGSFGYKVKKDASLVVQIKNDAKLVKEFFGSGAYKQLTVKQAWLLLLVGTEVGMWFFLGETIGKMHIVGYKV